MICLYQFTLSVPRLTNWQAYQLRVGQSSQRAFYVCREGRIGRILNVGGGARYVEVAPDAKDDGLWLVNIYDGSRKDEADVTRQLRRIFTLEADLEAFYSHCGEDPVLAQVIQRLQGARMLRDADVFSCALGTIISQQINLRFASELKRRLWQLAGVPVAVGGEILYADPSPEAIARLDYPDLQALQFTRRKAEYVIDFARGVTEGRFDLDALSCLSDEAAMDKLCSLRGFGRWTAECILLFSMGRPDLLPAKDVGLQRAATLALGRDQRIEEQELRQLAEAWRPWRSWATYYLWLALALPEFPVGERRS